MKKLTKSEFETLTSLLSKVCDMCENLSNEEFSEKFEDDWCDQSEMAGTVDSVSSIVFRLYDEDDE